MKKLFTFAALVLLALSSAVTAQQPESTLKPSVSAKKLEPVTLLLEIQYNPDVPPAYCTVKGPDEKPAWIWVTRFIRIPGAQTGRPIDAIKLEPQFNGETAGVRVTLLRGEKGFDQEDLVGVYHVGIGEQKLINDLRAAGVEPFSITLLNTVPPVPPPPAFENRTKSVEIASVRSENVPKPAYILTLRNVSDKNVLAVHINLQKDGRPGISSQLQDESGRPIMAPGGTYERYIPAETAQRTANGYAPGTATTYTLVIRSAVFADMSFEGDVETACPVESLLMGRRVWLKHVLPLIDEELSKQGAADSIAAAQEFKAKFSTLTYEFDQSDRNKPSSISPACAKPFEVAEIGPNLLKLKLLRDLDEIIDKRPSPPVNFKAWLEERRTYYKAWLARL